MADDSNIIDLANAKPRRQFRIDSLLRAPKPECWHYQTILDQAQRRLVCKDCGSLVEPFDWLMRLARRKEALDLRYDDLRAKIEAAEKTYQYRALESARLKAEIATLRETVAELRKQLRFEFGLPEEQIRKIKEKLK
jgi:hypothetical protein